MVAICCTGPGARAPITMSLLTYRKPPSESCLTLEKVTCDRHVERDGGPRAGRQRHSRPKHQMGRAVIAFASCQEARNGTTIEGVEKDRIAASFLVASMTPKVARVRSVSRGLRQQGRARAFWPRIVEGKGAAEPGRIVLNE